MYLSGKPLWAIAASLMSRGIPTTKGKTVWQTSTIHSILTNEKYKGCALLQKKYTVDFLTKKQKKNMGELPQYFVEDSHPAIIDPRIWELVQMERARRQKLGLHFSAKTIFSSRLFCGECGGVYGRRVWHASTKYAHFVWQCNRKYGDRTFCRTPHLTEDFIKKKFLQAFNTLGDGASDLILYKVDDLVFPVKEFDDWLWLSAVDSVIVLIGKKLIFRFRNGKEIKV